MSDGGLEGGAFDAHDVGLEVVVEACLGVHELVAVAGDHVGAGACGGVPGGGGSRGLVDEGDEGGVLAGEVVDVFAELLDSLDLVENGVGGGGGAEGGEVGCAGAVVEVRGSEFNWVDIRVEEVGGGEAGARGEGDVFREGEGLVVDLEEEVSAFLVAGVSAEEGDVVCVLLEENRVLESLGVSECEG